MRLKRIFSGVFATLMTVSMLSITTAADPVVTYEALAPTDFEGNEVTSLSEGDVIIVPIDASSTDGYMQATQISIAYDSSILTPGVEALTDSYTTAYAQEKSSRMILTNTTLMMGVRDIYKAGIFGNSYETSCNFNVVDQDEKVWLTWSSDTSGGYNLSLNSAPEYYIFFTVNDGVSLSGLNGAILGDLYVVASAGSQLTSPDKDYYGTTTKLNACYGAFTVSVNNDTYAETYKNWITEVNAYIYDYDGGTLLGTYTLDEYVTEDETTYSFPTRITTNGNAYTEAYVKIVATTNSQEDGLGTTGTQELAGKTISLTGTVTDYE